MKNKLIILFTLLFFVLGCSGSKTVRYSVEKYFVLKDGEKVIDPNTDYIQSSYQKYCWVDISPMLLNRSIKHKDYTIYISLCIKDSVSSLMYRMNKDTSIQKLKSASIEFNNEKFDYSLFKKNDKYVFRVMYNDFDNDIMKCLIIIDKLELDSTAAMNNYTNSQESIKQYINAKNK